MLREPTDLMLAPDLFAIDMHVEDSSGTFDHFGIDFELLFDRFRQTGGRGVVVSLHAIFDADVHRRSPGAGNT
jgi:hypothetical protein